MVEPKRMKEIADELYDAYRTANPITPVTADYDIDIDSAYDIQSQFIGRRLDGDNNIIGHKIGLTSQGIQDQLGVEEPDFGVILEDMVLSDNTIPMENLIQPRVEAEIGFILDDELTPPVSYIDVLQSIRGIVPMFEVIDSRIKDWDIKIEDTIADNASSALVVTGGQICSVFDKDLSLEGVKVYHNGSEVQSGIGADVLGHPAKSVAWLANKLDEYDETISAGELVLSGAPTPAIDIEPGDAVHAEFTSLGTVTARAE